MKSNLEIERTELKAQLAIAEQRVTNLKEELNSMKAEAGNLQRTRVAEQLKWA